MEKENTTPECEDKRYELDEDRDLKHKRSSILKNYRMSTDDVRSFRRVSFSSNFIKAFMTDDGKNTIWDTTIEEKIDNSQSNHSSESTSLQENNGFNTSLFLDNSDEGSLDMELTEPLLLPTNIQTLKISQKNNIYVSSSENILIEKENIPLVHKKNSSSAEKENIPINMQKNIPLREKHGEFKRLPQNVKISEDSDIDEMELTCQTGEISPDTDTVINMGLNLDHAPSMDTFDMNFTCQNPELSSSNGNMEFTCQNPILRSDANDNLEFTRQNEMLSKSAGCMELTCRNSELSENYVREPEDTDEDSVLEPNHNAGMEFTCQNPILPNVVKDMEFTCQNPVLPSSVVRDMEFTCQNPVLPSNVVGDMEFTCQNPVLPANVVGDMEFTCQNPVLPANVVGDMEFTCQNPVLPSNMEFTCQNPVLPSNVVRDTEFTCQNPVLPSSVVRNMEFTCQNPVLPSNVVRDMEFTCQNPVSSSTVVRDMEFTCQNPVLPLSVVRDMEFTRQNPVLPSDVVGDVEFTCQNPVLPSSVVRDMEFTCQNPVLPSNGVGVMKFTLQNPVLPPNKIGDTEFTCQNPVLPSTNIVNAERSNRSSAVMPDHVPDMEFSCQNPVLPSDSFMEISDVTCGRPELLHNSTTNAKTTRGSPVSPSSYVMNPESSPGSRESVADAIPYMEFTCQNPVLRSIPAAITITSVSPPTVPAITITFASPQTVPTISRTSASPPLVPTVTRTSASPPLVPNVTRTSASPPLVPIVTEKRSASPTNTITHTELTSENSVFAINIGENSKYTCQNPVVRDEEIAPHEDKMNNTHGDSRVVTEQNSILSFRNNGEGSNVKEYSTCVDETMQLLYSANMIINAKNATCDETSLVDVSKQQRNIVCSAHDDRETKTLSSTEVKIEPNENIVVEDREQDDVFSRFLTEEDILTPIDQESSVVLINNSNDHFSFELDISKTDPPLKKNETEKKFHETVPFDEKTTINADIEWNVTEYLAAKRERIVNLKQECAEIKLPSPHRHDRLEYYCNRLREARVKYVKLDKILKEKYTLFQQYRDRVLEECQNLEISREISEEESISTAEESDSIEQMVPSLTKEIEEKAKFCDGCWKIVKLQNGVGHFTTLFGKLEFFVEYNSCNLVNNFVNKSLLCNKAQPIAYFLQKELLRALRMDVICNSIGQHYNILSLLDYIQMVMEKIKKYYVDFKEMERSHRFTLTNDFKATFVLLDVELLIKWIFTMDLSDLESITKNSVCVNAPIGTVNEKYLLDFVSECPKGIEFVQKYFNKVEEYLGQLRKRKGFLDNKHAV